MIVWRVVLRCSNTHRYYASLSFAKSGLVNNPNAAGIYHLPDTLQRKAFGYSKKESWDSLSPDGDQQTLIDGLRSTSLQHLRSCSLLNQETMKPIKLQFDLPPLLGNSGLDEHFQKIGNYMSSSYLDMCQRYINDNSLKLNINQLDFERRSGWVRYSNDSPSTPVEFPVDDVITFDTEVMYEVHDYAVMATAVSTNAFYVWISPWLLGETQTVEHLVPLGKHKQVVIGHHIGFDRKRVLEEYSLESNLKWYMDTMAFHIALNGMCNQQRPTWLKFDKLRRQVEHPDATVHEVKQAQNIMFQMLKKDPWIESTCPNSLSETAKFHLGLNMDKSDRDLFGELNRDEVSDPKMLPKLLRYCLTDSIVTKKLFCHLLPEFLKINPHPVSFSALRHIASVFLPINEGWKAYIGKCECLYDEMQVAVKKKLEVLANEAALLVNSSTSMEQVNQDPWLKQLDWEVKPIKYTKATKSQPSRPVKNQKLPGKPKWFKDLFSSNSSPISLTSRTRTTALLLRLKWDDYPLVWFDNLGWCFWTPKSNRKHYENLNIPHVRDNETNDQSLFKLPHPDGDKSRCTNPLAKFYMQYFEDGSLSSENLLAKQAIKANLDSSYWISSRKRIMSQMPVYQSSKTTNMGLPKGWGLILPRMIALGAVTRRAVEDTWLTASNAKKDRVGSELKCNIQAPPGYKIIGADVDSEELWIAGVIGDSVLKMHGGTAFGWMTLEGSKKHGTDLHSKSAQILGISRNEAKTFNYGRIYGSGEASAARNLRKFNPTLSVQEAQDKAAALYTSTKGQRTRSKRFPLRSYWRGGTESVMYNQLEMLAELPRQQTPILGAGISGALASDNLGKNSFMTTRVNWSIQSSGVDYLHLIIAGMYYLCDVYGIKARLMLTVHDEVRYLVREEDALRAGLALQIANLWTRAMFCQQLGLENVPQSVAFFSAIDFDTVLRKEVDDPCLTPTQTNPLPCGEAFDMSTIIEKCDTLGFADQEKIVKYDSQPAEKRQPVMKELNDYPFLLDYVKAQLGTSQEAALIESSLGKNARHLKKQYSNSAPKKGLSARAKSRIPNLD